MGTENAILAATLADGHTVIRPAAQEPEVDDLIAFLQCMGAEVERTAPDVIEVEGRRRLRGAEHRVMPDRIEAGTFVVAGAITGGEVTVTGAPTQALGAFLDVLHRMGVDVSVDGETITVRGAPPDEGAYRAVDIATAPYPGLATDLQPPTAVLLTQAHGTEHDPRGDLRGPPGVDGRAAQDGRARGDRRLPPRRGHRARARLHGAEVWMSDLRAGASLILGALRADGGSLIHGAHQVRRGYENIERQVPRSGRPDRARLGRMTSPVWA